MASGRTHSWLFVPLLHAAVGRLHSDALDAWHAHALLCTAVATRP